MAGHRGMGEEPFQGKILPKSIEAALTPPRYVAKNIVAAGLAKKVEIQIAYAIGVASPVSISVNTFNTGTVPDEVLQEAVSAVVDLRPGAIIHNLNLRRPIYAQTAAYGHFGREELNLPWEKTDLARVLKTYVEEKRK